MKNSWIKDTPICGKGLFNNKTIIENTLPAIKKATDCGYNLFLNLSLTKDNRLVVCDSKKSSMLLSSGKKIEAVAYDNKEDLLLLNSEECVPLLSDVLELVSGRVGIIFKIDNNNKYKKIVTMLTKQLAMYKGKTAIVATSYPIYFFAKKVNKQLACGIVLKKSSSKFIYNIVLFANINWFKLIKPDFIICDTANLPNKYLDDYLLANPYSYIISKTITDKQSFLTATKFSDNYIFENYIPNFEK